MSKLTFMAFHVPLKNIKEIHVKKYYDCVFFKNIETEHVVHWNYDGRLYFGGWKGTF